MEHYENEALCQIMNTIDNEYKFEIEYFTKMINLNLINLYTEKKFSVSHTLTSLKNLSPIFFNSSTVIEIFQKISQKIKENKITIDDVDSQTQNYTTMNISYNLDGAEYFSYLKFYSVKPEEFSISKSEQIKIQKATKEHIPIIFNFVKELAEYEKSTDEVSSNEKILENSLFGEKSVAEGIICYYNEEPAGFAIFFHNFSTWTGKPGLYLDDLYVSPKFRGRGLGKNILGYLSKIAHERDCPRFEWWVLDWNEPSLEFYKSLGAVPMDEWTVYRLNKEGIRRLSEKYLS